MPFSSEIWERNGDNFGKNRYNFGRNSNNFRSYSNKWGRNFIRKSAKNAPKSAYF